VSGPFVVLDCGSIPQNLIESELFGHERGSFTGATSAYAGAFERADGGTVFLDEIGELPIEMQPKLLRVLERHEVRRIGGSKTVSVDMLVVAATNRDLGFEVNRGRFREDLYYRLAVARVHVPALRDRREDIPKLIEHFMTITPGGDIAQLAQETIDLMMRHDWPGNVRELRNVIERSVLLSEAPASEAAFRRTYVPGAVVPNQAKTDPDAGRSATEDGAAEAGMMSMMVDTKTPFKVAKRDLVAEFERLYITQILAEHGGNISAAARAAGIDRMSIHKMLNRLGLSNPGRE
jgi:two-component system response regulator HydG